MRKRNERCGTQDPMPSCEGAFALNAWKSNMFVEDDDGRRDMRRLFPEEWRCVETHVSSHAKDRPYLSGPISRAYERMR